MFISFAWTTPAYLSGRKTCTRRNWVDWYAAKFHKGDLVDAYDKNPRNGGHKIGLARLTHTPYQESTSQFPPEDYEAEGFKWMEENNILIRGVTPHDFCQAWIATNELVYVVRFEPVVIDASYRVCKTGAQLGFNF